MPATATERYAALTAWVEEAGGSLHPSVEIYIDEATEGSLRVRPGRSISAGDSIVKLPLVKSLSFLNAIAGHPDFPAAQGLGVATPRRRKHSNSSSSDATRDDGANNDYYFPTQFLRETPPHVVGRFFLIQQYLLGDESLWAPYIHTLPQPAEAAAAADNSSADGLLPCTWPPADLEFLRGTNAEIAVHEINATLDSEYAAAAAKLLSSSAATSSISPADYTPSLYKWAYCIFASRSFRQSLTIPGATSSLGGSPPLTSRPDDFSVLLPLFDMGNHHPLAKTAWKTPQDNNNNNTTTANGADAGAFCELQTGQPYTSGQQVFNNYGPSKTNAELLLGYGFVLAEDDGLEGGEGGFHNDYVHVKTRPGGGGNDTHHQHQQQQLASTHLVSLHPVSHPSSLAARVRRTRRSATDPNPDRPESIMSCYTHVQDSLVAALYEAICQARGTATKDDGVTLPQILAGDIPEDVTDEIINALGTKLSIDLEKIEAAEAEMQASGKGEPRNGNQQVALLYRNQCKRVLENALASLSGDEYEVGEEEEEEV